MPKSFFNVHMLPARFGDALLIEYGEKRTRRILVDGGPLSAYPEMEAALQAKLPDGDQRVELLVITHVDTDHVEGIIRLLAMPEQKWPFSLQEIWFNGWRHIEEARDLGGREGEFVSALIARRAGSRWNTRFQGHAVVVGALPGDRVTLEDQMVLTLLSPDAKALEALLKDWKSSATSWEIDPGNLDRAWAQLVELSKFHPGAELTLGPDDLTGPLRKLLKGKDKSAANGSSIAFLAEYGGRGCLFLGDAHMSVICKALEARGCSKSEPLVVDAVKMSHHGSKNNITPHFLELVDAEHWLISTDGEQHDHPDKSAIEAVLAGARRTPTLWFNYRVPQTERWENVDGSYVTKYPKAGESGITVVL